MVPSIGSPAPHATRLEAVSSIRSPVFRVTRLKAVPYSGSPAHLATRLQWKRVHPHLERTKILTLLIETSASYSLPSAKLSPATE